MALGEVPQQGVESGFVWDTSRVLHRGLLYGLVLKNKSFDLQFISGSCDDDLDEGW